MDRWTCCWATTDWVASWASRGGSRAGPFGGVGSLFGGPPVHSGCSGTPWDGGIGWLLPLAVALATIGLWLALRQARDGRAVGTVGCWAYLLWSGWLVTHLAVFSFMSGIVHSYYAVTLAPAVAAIVGMGVADIWAWRHESMAGRR